MPCSHNYHSYECCYSLTLTLAPYQPPAACCRFVAALLICRSWGAKTFCCTRTAGKQRVYYLNLSRSDPSHREVGPGRQAARGTISRIPSPPAHPHTRAALISSAGQYSARVSAAHWSQTHSGSFQTLGGVVASHQSPAGQLTQPAGRWLCTQNSKSHFPLSYILTGIGHRVFGVDKEKF